jgi:Domain of unknown function (DUF4262)
MLDKFEWPKIEDEGDEVVVRNVRKHGCHIVSITDGEPPYEFSIGLFLNYDQAELIIFGLEANDSVGVINSVRDRAAAGRKYLAGEICDDLLIESRICFIDAPFPAFVDYMGIAIWFYRKLPRPFPCLQMVWSDRNGLFPWNPGYDERLKGYQPLLKIPS